MGHSARSAQFCMALRMCQNSLAFPKAKRLLTHLSALSETVMSHALLKIENKLILLSDVKTDVLMTCVALS